jgi:hypothetical protein
MNRALWVYISKGEAKIIFKDDFAGDFFTNKLVKKGRSVWIN